MIQVNKEHQAIFDLIADGLWGLRRLLAFTESFPGYNLEKDLEYLYQDSVDSVAVKKLVTCGLEIAFEELLQEQQVILDDVAELSQLDTSTTVNNQVNKIKTDDKPEAETNKADDSEKEETVSIHLSDSKKKKRRSKDRRQKRLLKFQEKLVMTHGLPPSRLMVGKRLSSEFEHLAGVASTPSTGSPSIGVGSLPPPLQQPGAVLGVGYHHVPPTSTRSS